MGGGDGSGWIAEISSSFVLLCFFHSATGECRLKPLFDKNVLATDPAYITLRDDNRPEVIKLRHYAENLWEKYHPYADRHFLVEISKDFNARFWEMYLACTFMDKGYEISSRDEGPDIKIKYGEKIIWIEAVAPTGGDPSKPDSVPAPIMGVAQEVPDRQITLRYRSEINDKYFDKYFKYVTDGIISNDDCYVIALNGCRISLSKVDYEPPRIVRSVLPFGWQVVTVDTASHKIVKRGYQYRTYLRKESGSQVDTNIFVKPEYEHISAVMFSNVDVANRTPVAGDDFIIVCNPLTLKPLPDDFPKLGREYWAKLSKDTVTLFSKNWTES